MSQASEQLRGSDRGAVLTWLGCWALLAVGTLLIRPLIPIDETRYAAVAWEMWWRHSFLVPYLNGHIYAEKPPMFFWLMQLGWAIFGVNNWWPRLIAPLATLASLFLTRRLAQRLWPGRGVHRLAPIVLASSFYWALFTAATMFDMILAALVLVVISALVEVWQSGRFLPFWLAGAALGIGALTKGPVILLPVAGVVLLAPWWMGSERVAWLRWFGGFALAVAVAFAIGFAWLISATVIGGEAYMQAIGLHQTADSIVHSFTHARPFWWYLPLLPLMFLPWSLWPATWRSLRAAGATPLADSGVRLCIAWALPAFVALSFISAKQPHYLLPLFPAVALALGRVLDEHAPVRSGPWLIVGLSTICAAMSGAMTIATPASLPHVPTALAAFSAISFAVLALGLRRIGRQATFIAGLRVTAVGAVVWLLLLGGALFIATWPQLDVRPIASEVGYLTTSAVPIGHAGSYNGEYHFYPRLQSEIVELRGQAISPWVRANPTGDLIAVYPGKLNLDRMSAEPIYRQTFRGDVVMIWRNADIIAHPELIERAHK